MTRTANGWSSNATGARGWPTTWGERHAEYARRESVYQGGDYALRDFERLGLFQATDSTGVVTHKTRRVCTMLAFVANVDAAALANGWTLNVSRDAVPPDVDTDGRESPSARSVLALESGLEVWKRSEVEAQSEAWSLSLAVAGDLFLEASVDEAGRAIVYAHRPQHVSVWYDRYGRRVERAVVEFTYRKPDSNEDQTYKRTITADEIVTEDTGAAVWKVVDVNPTGVVTLLHVPFKPVGTPGFSANAWHGLEDAVAVYDSAITQMGVIGGRHAAPWLKIMGGALEANDQTNSNPGRTLSLPTGVDAQYLEASLQGIGAFVEQADRVRSDAALTVPEFLFTDAGAGASGTALSHRAGAFVHKMEPVRHRLWRALAKATGIALALERGQRFTEAEDVYEVTGGPALPMDRAAESALLVSLVDADLLLRSDAIRAMQGFGVVPREADPIAYAETVEGHAAEAEERTIGALGKLRGESPAPRGKPDAMSEDDDEQDISSD